MSHAFDQSDLEAIASIEAFRALSTEDIRKLARIGRFLTVPRGALLVRQGEPADVLYYVLNGRFAVQVEGRKGAINEIRRGEPIGEIAFFRGGARTANVRAKRDSLVLAFDQNQMDELSRSAPRFTRALITSLADRLAHATPRLGDRRIFQPPSTIAVVGAGNGDRMASFVRQLSAELKCFGKTGHVGAGDVPQRFCPPLVADPHDITGWIEAVEDETDFAVFDTSGMDDGLKRHILPVVDCVLIIAAANDDPALLEIEEFVAAHCNDCDVRLVLLHDTATPVHSGTARWLTLRQVSMHHHVVEGDIADVARIARFLTGNAIGFVASGGGAICAAQVGVYKAFREHGVRFDIFGGTSAGAAMAAAFAYGLEADEVDARVEDIFLTRRAMGRFTIPRYSLFDHHPFDAALRAHYGETCIEDLHVPFFALSTNLSTGEEHVHRTGPVWQAVRASGAIPGLLPPFYTARGEMLVDGCLLDNVPLRVMQSFSAGPNVVVAFRMGDAQYFDVKYEDLPGRWQLASSLPNFLTGRALPKAPGIAEVLTRAITLSPDTELSGSPRDLVIVPPIRDGVGIMSWDHHTVLMRGAYAFTKDRILHLERDNNALLAPFLPTS